MCLIVYRPEGAAVPVNVIEKGFRPNSDGWGVMYPKGDGTLRIIKGVYDMKTIKRVFALVGDRPMAMHFRMATHGAVDIENCHPFRLLSKEKHGRDLAMMHNGVLRTPTDSDRSRSDTWHFAYRYIVPVLQRDPSLIDVPEFRKMISDTIGGGNKLTFMDGEGKTYLVNETAGTWAHKSWFSSGWGWDKDLAATSTEDGYGDYEHYGWY